MSSHPIVGIDLGTTYSLVGIVQAGAPVLLPNALGERLTPSVVSIDDNGEILVGAAARDRAVSHPERTASTFKRDMGTSRSYRLGGRDFRPEELSACVLSTLRRDAEAVLGETVEEAVITVPAYFGDLQRQATRQAGELAGLRVERIINEPTAAALAYGFGALDRELKAVVLDLGGGTFDVTVLEIIEGVIEIQSSSGDARLGGEDFDDALVGYVEQRVSAEHGTALAADLQTRARVRMSCEAAKRRLSREGEAELVLPRIRLAGGRELDLTIRVSREQAEAAWQPVLQRIRAPIQRALRDARLDVRDIDEVLLVGGSTRMPCFVQLAALQFERMPLRDLPPDEAVAMGAAVQAALKRGDRAVEDLVVTDVAPFSLGVATAAQSGTRVVTGLFSPIIQRGTVIPTSRVERYGPLSDEQKSVEFEVYQGEHAMVEGNTKIGRCEVKLPRAAAGVDRSVDVRFTYDLNGLLEVDVTPRGSDHAVNLVIEQRPGALSTKQLALARAHMSSLKFHPRDALPNRTALAHADRLFTELVGEPRAALSAAIVRFQAALDEQDPRQIVLEREHLVATLATMRGEGD